MQVLAQILSPSLIKRFVKIHSYMKGWWYYVSRSEKMKVEFVGSNLKTFSLKCQYCISTNILLDESEKWHTLSETSQHKNYKHRFERLAVCEKHQNLIFSLFCENHTHQTLFLFLHFTCRESTLHMRAPCLEKKAFSNILVMEALFHFLTTSSC